MNMLPDRVLSPAELRVLSGRSNADGALRLAIHVALLAGTGWLVEISGPLTLAPGDARVRAGAGRAVRAGARGDAPDRVRVAPGERDRRLAGGVSVAAQPALLHGVPLRASPAHADPGAGPRTGHGAAQRSGRLCAAHPGRALLAAASAGDRRLLARRSEPLSLCVGAGGADDHPQRPGDERRHGRRGGRSALLFGWRRRSSSGFCRSCSASRSCAPMCWRSTPAARWTATG